MTGEITRFTDCRVLRDHEIYEDDIWFSDGVILDPEKEFFVNKHVPQKSVSLDGAIVAPGFIDIQINGKKFYYDLIPHFLRPDTIYLI